MKLVIGLGNPGKKYKNNRHNVGYMVIDQVKREELRTKNFKALKSDKFMNNSGSFVKKLTTDYGLPTNDLYVVHDDLDIKLGSYKIQFGKGPKDHNGLKSIGLELGTSDYWHVRVGIENRNQERGIRKEGYEYVLEDFTAEEVGKVEQVVKEVVKDLCKRLEA
jgi:PTH1 family peptidyl-tRNA hydrolase